MLLPSLLILLTLFDLFTPGRVWAEPPDPVGRAGCVRPYHRPPPSESAVAGARLEFQLCRDAWQEHLQSHYTIRVWVAGTTQLVAELPMPLVGTILTQFVASAGLTATYLGLPEAPRRSLASAPSRTGPPPVGVPPKALQAARQAARRARAGRAGRKPRVAP